MQVPDQLRAQDAALDYLKKNITKDDMVAVLFYTSTIQVLTDFTGDRDVLTSVIKRLPIGEASELAALADTGDENGEDTQRPSWPTKPNSTSSTPTRSWRRSSRPPRCWPRFPRRRRWSISRAA